MADSYFFSSLQKRNLEAMTPREGQKNWDTEIFFHQQHEFRHKLQQFFDRTIKRNLQQGKIYKEREKEKCVICNRPA